MPDRFYQIEEDLRDLKGWTTRHEEEHTADKNLLSSILDSVTSHQANHHGRTSTIKQGGAVGVFLSFLYVVVELLRRLVF